MVMLALTAASHLRLTDLSDKIQRDKLSLSANGFLGPDLKVPHIIQLKLSASFLKIFPAIFIFNQIEVRSTTLINHVKQIIHAADIGVDVSLT